MKNFNLTKQIISKLEMTKYLNYTKYMYPHLEIEFKEFIKIEKLKDLNLENKLKEFIKKGLWLLINKYKTSNYPIYMKIIMENNKSKNLLTDLSIKEIEMNTEEMVLKIYEEIIATDIKILDINIMRYSINEYMKEYSDEVHIRNLVNKKGFVD
jgi:hypothetical protein